MNVEDRIQQRIEQARRKIAADKAARTRRQAARTAGLLARHTAKLAHLGLDNSTPAPSGAA